jgi:hypothetical protein
MSSYLVSAIILRFKPLWTLAGSTLRQYFTLQLYNSTLYLLMTSLVQLIRARFTSRSKGYSIASIFLPYIVFCLLLLPFSGISDRQIGHQSRVFDRNEVYRLLHNASLMISFRNALLYPSSSPSQHFVKANSYLGTIDTVYRFKSLLSYLASYVTLHAHDFLRNYLV